MEQVNFGMIENLNIDAPQFDYIKTLWPGEENAVIGLAHVDIFLDRIKNDHVKEVGKLEAYRSSKDLQLLIQDIYGLDPEKFWYLVLFASDYSMGKGQWIEFHSPKEQLDNLFSLMGDNLVPHEFPQQGYDFSHDRNMSLKLSVAPKGKKYQTTAEVNLANAMKLLQLIYESADKEQYEGLMEKQVCSSFGSDKSVSSTVKIACFTKMLDKFLQPYNAAPSVYYLYSKSKMSFIAQCIYTLQLTDEVDGNFNHSPAKYLTDYIKQYKNIHFDSGENSYYDDAYSNISEGYYG